MRRPLVPVLLAAALCLPTADAGSLGGVTMPETMTVAGEKLQLNGMGLRKKLWIKVYVGGLYLQQPSSSPQVVATSDQVKRMRMRFLTDRATREKLSDAWYEGFAANCGADARRLSSEIDRFVGWFGDMSDGDVVDITYVPGTGTTVAVNGAEEGTIPGEAFADALFMVWVGPEPPSGDFKEGILGG